MVVATTLLTAARLVLITLWTGSLWAVGYLVAPTLFATLPDSVLAGTIAGRLFRVEAWLSVALAISIALLVMASKLESRQRLVLLRLVVAMLACTVVGYFGLQPMMAAIREAAPGGMLAGSARTQFGILHGVASVIYLVQSVLAVVLVLKNQARPVGMDPER